MLTQPKTPVTILVAMSESGVVLTQVADSHWLQEKKKCEKLLDEIRQSKQLWTIRYIKTEMPYPISTEKIDFE